MEALLRDLRYSVRVFVRNPAFTLVAVLTLTLGIGLTTAVFSLINALLLRPLPVDEPGELYSLTETSRTGDPFPLVSIDKYRQYESGGRAFESGIAAQGMSDLSFNSGAEPEVLVGNFVSGNYFRVLGIAPARGRFFAPGEDRATGASVAVISHRLWTRRFGSDPSIVGRTVTLNSQPMTVVGIAPPEFRGIVGILPVDVWIPLASFAQVSAGSEEQIHGSADDGVNLWLSLFGRLPDGASPERAQVALSALARQIPPETRNAPEVERVEVRPLSSIPVDQQGSVIGFLALLLATAGLVLLISCVNVAGMLLARAASRPREIAIRLAVGAQHGRLVSQLLTEGLLLFLLGGLGGILLAMLVFRLVTVFQAAVPESVELDISPDLRVLGFALFLSLATGVLFSLIPALQASRPSLVPSLKSSATVGGPRRSRLRNAFVVGQIAASLLLLVVAGLFVRALSSAVSTDPGFDPRGVVVATVDLSPHGYTSDRGAEFYRQLVGRVRELPGVSGVALASGVPLGTSVSVVRIRVEGYEPPADRREPGVSYYVVSPGYFAVMRTPLVAGREFSEADRQGGARAVIVNEALARRYWRRESALGKRVRIRRQDMEVVGVVKNSVYEKLGESPQPHLYLPVAQSYAPRMTLHVRTAQEAAPVMAGIRREVQTLDGNLPLQELRPLSRQVEASLFPQRVAATLIGTFGMLGLLLAVVGLYGILAYSVTQRAYEIGVRLALGAEPTHVLRMVVMQGLRLVLVGGGIGLVVALAATRLLAGALYGVSPTDAVTFLGVMVLLVVAAVLASWLPARRAARVSPMLALRAE